MSIKARLIAVLAVILLVFSGAAVITLVNLSAQLPKLEATETDATSVADLSIPLAIVIKDIQLDVVQVQQWITDISATRGLPGFDDGFTEAAAFAEKFKEDVQAARDLALALELNEVVVALNETEQAFGPFYETGIKMGETYVAKGPEEGNVMMEEFDGVAGAMGENMEALLAKVSESTSVKLEVLEEGIHEVQTSIEGVQTLNMVLTIIGVIIGLGAAGYLVVLIKGSIEALIHDIEQISNHDYVGETQLSGERTDEFGTVARALQETKQALIASQEREQAQQEADQRHAEERKTERLRMAEQFETSVGSVVETVSAAASEVQSSAQSVSGTADQTSSQATNVAAAAEQASANVQTVASAAEELSSSISEISRQVSQSTQIAGTAVAEVEGANDKVQGLAEAANKIGEVVALITDIADQTNLLALNATIEAARAGEAGKGFAVVASEVKNLANQTAKATEEISNQIGGIQGATKDAVTAIGSIGGIINQINEITSAIAAAVEEQGAATSEIARNVEQASSGTQEVSSNISQVTQAASETGSSATQILDAAGELTRQSSQLSGEVHNFLNTIRG
ncbi:methyl-accepting chemotaxis protein [Magnetovibrio sp. PR-2]|uniref:methyl-accepting chemotaxis protein n=1 Tax=Magnetovibrio sp. PR-2 TaxID=3120356 RepID=UPI002FCE5E65